MGVENGSGDRVARAGRRLPHVVAVATALVLSAVVVPAAGAVTLRGTVSDVIDGDTIRVVSRGFETPVRLIGVDTPETRHPTTGVQCFGPEATARTTRLLPEGTAVRLVTDPTQDVRDRYGRLLAYVYRAGRSGPTGSVNFSLVRSGHARAYVHDGVRFRYAVPFLRAHSRARTAKLGLWGPPCRGRVAMPDAARPASSGDCDPNYAGACIAPGPPDVDCIAIPDRNFRVIGVDVHRLDVDGDGIACEE
ncbi:thermonuclease family protein [Miltoncostaea oceani]|jgi:micrococcal nuclease|uniref:thermonuclease family protein n=1 Tax=Miltoncostaea oceani TaxID=2843216 RepID=UPI001C3DEE35|nr:thermonuclease family protein [Miltoncostaea oceani]